MRQNWRIIYLHQYFNTPEMPGGTRSYEMARRLVDMGHEVHLVTSDQNSSQKNSKNWHYTKEAGIHVYWLPVPYSNFMSYQQRIRAFYDFAWKSALKAASLPGDIVFASSTPLTIALPAVYAAKRKKIPMVFEVRDLWPELPIAVGALKSPLFIWAAKRLERFAYRNSKRIVALSPGMKEGVVATGYPSQQVATIPNSSDLELFDVPDCVGEAFRVRYDWLLDRPLVVYTGTLGVIHGVDYLARLADVVKNLDPEIRFLIVGNGRQRTVVEETANNLGVLNKTFFMWDNLSKRDMAPVLSAATIATSLVIDLKELWPNSANKFFDALASGTPIAINYKGWQADILETNQAGLVLDTHDIKSAAELLVKRIRDRDWIQQAEIAAKKLARERFSRDKLAEQLESVLSDAVKG